MNSIVKLITGTKAYAIQKIALISLGLLASGFIQFAAAAENLFSEFQGAEADELISVIVTLDDADREIKQLRKKKSHDRADEKGSVFNHHAQRRNVITRHQDKTLARLDKRNYRLARKYSELPFLSLKVDRQGLNKLLSNPDVTVSKVHKFRPLLASSIPIILDDLSYDPSLSHPRGAGRTIAILDTGVDKMNAFLGSGSRVVSEACYSTLGGEPGSLETACPGGVAVELTTVGSGIPCDVNSYSECNHGTLVAGVAAGNGTSYDGVATASDLMAVNVYSYDFFPGLLVAYENDVLSGLARVLEVHNENNSIELSSVLLAFGNQTEESGDCDTLYGPLKIAISALKAEGIATVIASGNNGYGSGINAPACISSAISVGASTDGDVKWPASNEGTSLNLYAPGVSITSSDVGGSDTTSDGTSFAAAHVAGAWAVIHEAYPEATVGQVLTVLQDTGIAVTGNTPSGAKRIDLKAALGVEIPVLDLPDFFIIPTSQGGAVIFSL